MEKKKGILICCGSGIATSTIVMDEVRTLAKKANINYKPEFYQCSLQEVDSLIDNCSLIISTQRIRKEYPVPVIRAIGVLSGIGIEENRAEIIAGLEQICD